MSSAGQTASAPERSSEVMIDRLVLDIPGLTPVDATVLAKEIGGRLAVAGLSGEHARVGVTLGPVGINQRELAANIVAALMERLV